MWLEYMNNVMPESDGPENLKILKNNQLGVDFGQCWQTVGLSAIEAYSWSWVPTMVLRSFKNRLSPSVEELKSEVNKQFVPEQRSLPVFLHMYCYYGYYWWLWLYNIISRLMTRIWQKENWFYMCVLFTQHLRTSNRSQQVPFSFS